jgi:hypothetical protein
VSHRVVFQVDGPRWSRRMCDKAAGWNTGRDELRAPLPQCDGVGIGKACERVEVIAGRVPHQRDTGHRHQSVVITERFYVKWAKSRLRQQEGDVIAAMRRIIGATVTVDAHTGI